MKRIFLTCSDEDFDFCDEFAVVMEPRSLKLLGFATRNAAFVGESACSSSIDADSLCRLTQKLAKYCLNVMRGAAADADRHIDINKGCVSFSTAVDDSEPEDHESLAYRFSINGGYLPAHRRVKELVDLTLAVVERRNAKES